VSEQDTTAVLPPNAGQASETQTGSTPAKQPTIQFVAQSGYQAQTGPPVSSAQQGGEGGQGGNAKTGTERKRSGRLSDDIKKRNC